MSAESNQRAPNSKPRGVLADHKKKRSRFIPPMLHMLPAPMKYTSWRTTELPEVVWISLLHRKHGDRRAARFSTMEARQLSYPSV